MSAFAIAEARSRKSRSSVAFMAGYDKGRECAASGEEPRMTGRSAAHIAGFIEGLASWRAKTATPRDYVPYSAARQAVTS